ncbi:hypothetical protein AB1N83_005000 [Pleurotus pulmonarius]
MKMGAINRPVQVSSTSGGALPSLQIISMPLTNGIVSITADEYLPISWARLPAILVTIELKPCPLDLDLRRAAGHNLVYPFRP